MDFDTGELTRPEATPWTDEETATAKRLWDGGLSANEIGFKLNKTRNSVISRLHRKGLSVRGVPFSVLPRKPRPPRLATDAPVRPGPKPPPRPSVARRASLPLAAKAPAIPEPPSLFKTLWQLEPNECHWPVNGGDPYIFCGAAKEGPRPYCPHHTRKAAAPTGLAQYWKKATKVGKFYR
jgi:GcrA cell cycle regulator